MQRLILTLLICLGFALPGSASAWWQDDWQFRKQICDGAQHVRVALAEVCCDLIAGSGDLALDDFEVRGSDGNRCADGGVSHGGLLLGQVVNLSPLTPIRGGRPCRVGVPEQDRREVTLSPTRPAENGAMLRK